MTDVYAFDHPHELPPSEVRALIGSKAANIVVMASELGLPVPPGFTVSTATCNAYLAAGWPEGLDDALRSHMRRIEEVVGRRFGGLAGLEGGIALTKGALVPPPVVHEAWFHVEHTPVQVTSSLLRTALNQSMNLRIDRLDREQLRQLCKARDRPPGKPGFDSLWPDPHANRLAPTAGYDPPHQHERVGSAANQGLVPPRPE